jgi:hypothetical protein
MQARSPETSDPTPTYTRHARPPCRTCVGVVDRPTDPVCNDSHVPDVTLAGVLIGGIPSLIVALVGIGGVVYTQRRADARQDRIAAANRRFERQSRTLDRRRELGAEFVSAVWLLASESRDLVPDGAGYSDLKPVETAEVRRTLSTVCMVLDRDGREAAERVFDALLEYVGTFTQETWDAIGTAEDALVEVINEESRDDPGTGR